MVVLHRKQGIHCVDGILLSWILTVHSVITEGDNMRQSKRKTQDLVMTGISDKNTIIESKQWLTW